MTDPIATLRAAVTDAESTPGCVEVLVGTDDLRAVLTILSQCQADLAAMTAERDDLIERHGEVAERMVLAESDLAAARGALETTRAVLLGALDRWNGDVTERGEGRLVDAVRRVTDDLGPKETDR